MGTIDGGLRVLVRVSAVGPSRRVERVFRAQGWTVSRGGGGEVLLVEAQGGAGAQVGVIALVQGVDDPLFSSPDVAQVDGIVHRDDSDVDLVRAVREVATGHGWISPRLIPRYRRLVTSRRAGPELGSWRAKLTDSEFETAALVVSGLSNKQVARHRHLSETTIKAHMTSVLRKLGCTSRSELVVLAHRG